MLTFQNDSGVYKAVQNDVVIAKSKNLQYLKQKAKKLMEDQVVTHTTPKVDFPINQRFTFVEQLVNMVATKQTPSCIITGEGGLGKSFTVLQALKNAGLRDISEFEVNETVGVMKAFRIVKGFSTAKGLYRILYENQNNIVVFDDTDSILRDVDATNLLKGALDSYEKRYITWNTSSDNDGIPRFFEFKGSIIFISNMKAEKIDQAIRSRSLNIDLSMTQDEKIERMEFIISKEEFLPGIAQSIKEEALETVREFKSIAKELSLRSLINVAKIRASGNNNWKLLAKYTLTN